MKRMHSMFVQIPFISNISKKTVFCIAFLMLCLGGYGQTVTISDISGAEDDGDITVTATLDIASGSPFSVDVSTADGLATLADNDYTAVVSQTLNFAGTAGEEQTFTVTPISDSNIELDETINISMGNLVGAVVTIDDTAIVTITNDDFATATITATDDTATENLQTTGTFTVSIGSENGTGSPITVNYTISTGGSNATNTTDYVTIANSVFIPDGSSSSTITITPIDDTVVEGPETVILTLGAGTGYTVGAPAVATVTITDNDSASLTIAATTQAEEDTTDGLFTISTTAQFSTATTVTFTVGGNATEGTDYTAIGTTVNFPANTDTVTIPVEVTADAIVENDETVTVTITGTDNSDVTIGATDEATVTITDDDGASLSIAATSQAEEDTTDGLFTISTTAQFSTATTVTFTVGGNATEGTDYTAIGTTVNFPANTDTVTIPVEVTADAIVENDETVTVTITGTDNPDVTIGATDEATVTITDNDGASLSIAATSQAEEDTTDGLFTISTTAQFSTATTVTFTVGGNATEGTDYTAIGTTVNFPANTDTVTIPVEVTADAIVENDETVTVTITGTDNPDVTIGATDEATVTITDNDGASLSIAATSQAEEDTTDGLFTISTTAQFSTATTVTFTVGGNATEGTDYTAIGTTVNFPANTDTVTIPVEVTADAIVENDETVTVTITGTDNPDVTIGATDEATVTITDDDSASLSIAATTQAEEDTTDGLFTISTTAQFSTATTVTFTVGGNATEGTDYTAIGTTVNFPANTDTVTIPVEVTADAIVENDETVTVTITGTDNPDVTIGATDEATVTITDDDGASLSIAATSQAEEDTTDGLFTISTTAQFSTATTVTFTVGGNATEGTDYTAIGTTVNFPANTDTVTIPVEVTADAIVENDETVTVTITGTDNPDVTIGATDEATVTITDDDSAGYTLSLSTLNTSEAGVSQNFTVVLTAAPATDVVFSITSDDTAEGTVSPGTLTFTPANFTTPQAVTVTGVDDAIVDGTQPYTVTVSVEGASSDDAFDALADQVINATNTDDDTAGFTVTESGGSTATSEPDGTDSFTVVLTAAPATDVVFSITSDDTAEGTVSPGTLTFTPANFATPQAVTVTGVDDAIVDGTQPYTITVSVEGASSDDAFDALADQVINATNTDDDTAGFTVTESGGSTATSEPDGTDSFTVVLTAAPATDVVFSITSDDTAEGTVSPGTLTFTPANFTTPQAVTVTGVDDAIVDGTQPYTVTVSVVDASSDDAFDALADQVINVSNSDNDIASLLISDIAANEDNVTGVLEFNVILDIAVNGGFTVSYSFADDTATGGGVDYTGTPDILTFDGSANETKTITVPINDDTELENTETFTIQLGLPSNTAVQRLNGGTAIGTINDDDNCIGAPILDTSISSVFCDVIDLGLDEFTQSTPPSGNPNISLRWSRNSDPLNENAYLLASEVANPPNEGSYYGFFLDNNGTPDNFDDDCASGTIEVEIVLNTTPILTSGNVSGGERCGPGTVLLSATPSAGASINWYTALDAIAPVASGPDFTTPVLNTTRSYFAEATENGCVSERIEVIATIGFQASVGTASNGSICNVVENGPTIIDLDDRLVGEGTGVWTISSDPSSMIVLPASNIIDFRDLVAGDYIFTFTTTSSTLPCENVSVDVTISVSDCETDEDGDGLLGGEEATLGTLPDNPDTDGDGIDDGTEVGPDVNNPNDADGDGIIDALESAILDTDSDGVPDQQDPANNDPCLPNRQNGICDFDGDDITDSDEIINGTDPDNPCDPNAEHPNCLPIDLEVTKSVDRLEVASGDTVIFTVSLTNLDQTRPAIDVIVGDLLGIGFEFVGSEATVGSYSEVTGEWNISEIMPTSSETLQITATITEEGNYTNTAELLSSLPIDGNSANDSDTVQLNVEVPEGVDLFIQKEARPDKALVGGEVEFLIRVSNISQTDIVRDIVINDLIVPENGFEFISAQSDFNGSYDQLSGDWSLPELGLDETATLRIRARVPQKGTFTNTARLVRSSPKDSDPSNDEATITVEVIDKSPADPGFLYNQFSPNGNNQNEILRINRTDPETGLEVSIEYTIKIYDRYGNLVFETTKVNDADVWDGTYKGNEVPKGTYFYILNYSIDNGPLLLDKGWIQLIR